jgi:hypothetical protein
VASWKTAFPQDGVYVCGQVTWQGGDTGSLVGACVGDASAKDLLCCMLNQGWVSMQAGDNGSQLTEVVRAASAFSSGTYIGLVRSNSTTFRCYTSTDGQTWATRGTSQTVATIASNATPGFAVISIAKYLGHWEAGLGGLPTTRSCGGP